MDEMRKKLNQQYKRAGEKKERGGKTQKKKKNLHAKWCLIFLQVNFVGKDARHKFQPASFETQKTKKINQETKEGKKKS